MFFLIFLKNKTLSILISTLLSFCHCSCIACYIQTSYKGIKKADLQVILSNSNGKLYFNMPVFFSTNDWCKLSRNKIVRRLIEESCYTSEHFITHKSLAAILKNPCQNVKVFNKNHPDIQLLNGKTIAKHIKKYAEEQLQELKELLEEIDSKKSSTDREQLEKKIKRLRKEIDIMINRNCTTAAYLSPKDLANLILCKQSEIVVKENSLTH